MSNVSETALEIVLVDGFMRGFPFRSTSTPIVVEIGYTEVPDGSHFWLEVSKQERWPSPEGTNAKSWAITIESLCFLTEKVVTDPGI